MAALADSSNLPRSPSAIIKNPRKFRRTPSGLVDCWHTLTTVFGKPSYKGKQAEIVDAAVRGADVFVVAPTGMGKSLCFQVPAMADEHGITIVVSPLLSLMKDQVNRLQEIGIPAVSLTSETSQEEKSAIAKDLISGHPSNRLLYITPEKLVSTWFQNIIMKTYRQKELSRLVIDEAHCISEWGHEFRADYRKLGMLRDSFKDVPIMALTASATPAVQDDIVANLKLSHDHLFKVVHPFNRGNLFYEVKYLPFQPEPKTQYATIHQYIAGLTEKRGIPSCGIIYARTRATCDDLARFLSSKGIKARAYHKGISATKLDETLAQWSNGVNCDVVIATICFGMGIDKADVRYVIHYDLPKSFEGFYQETGRAGRDGEPSKCIIYYSREDVVRLKKLVQKSYSAREQRSAQFDEPQPSQRAPKSFEALIRFCENTTVCRHILICRYFGERIDTSDPNIRATYCDNMCDVCKNPERVKRKWEELSSDDFVLTQAARLEQEVTPRQIEDDEDEDGYPKVRPVSIVSSSKLLERPRDIQQPRRLGLSGTYPSTNPLGKVKSSATTSSRSNDNSSKKPTGWWQTDKSGEGTGGMMLRLGTKSSPINLEEDEDLSSGVMKKIASGSRMSDRKRSRSLEDEGSDEEAPKKSKPAMDALKTVSRRPASKLHSFKVPFKKTPRSSTPEDKRSRLAITTEEVIAQPSNLSDDEVQSVPSELSSSGIQSRPLSRHPSITESEGNRCSSPMELPETIEAEASFSQKIPLEVRLQAIESLHKYLHKALMRGLRAEDLWSNLGGIDISNEERGTVVVQCAQQSEFFAMSYSVTSEGYRQRSSRRIEAAKLILTDKGSQLLQLGAAAEEDREEVLTEEIKEINSILRKLVQAQLRRNVKGKQRAPFNRSRNREATPDMALDPNDSAEDDGTNLLQSIQRPSSARQSIDTRTSIDALDRPSTGKRKLSTWPDSTKEDASSEDDLPDFHNLGRSTSTHASRRTPGVIEIDSD